MKLATPRQTLQQVAYDEDQGKVHKHKEEQACLKKIIRKMNGLFGRSLYWHKSLGNVYSTHVACIHDHIWYIRQGLH